MSRTTLTTVALIAFVWTAMLSFGGVAAETVMLYPNVFGAPPASLDRAREFLVAGGPSDYFPPLGATVVLSSLVAAALTWREPRLRWWFRRASVRGRRPRHRPGCASRGRPVTAQRLLGSSRPVLTVVGSPAAASTV